MKTVNRKAHGQICSKTKKKKSSVVIAAQRSNRRHLYRLQFDMLAQPSRVIRLPKATGSSLKISSSSRSLTMIHTHASSPRECFWFARLVVNEGKRET